MAKRFIDTELFRKRFVRELSSEDKLLWIYIFTTCDFAGLWETDTELASLMTGTQVTLEHIKQKFSDRMTFVDNDAKAFIPEFVTFQYGELSTGNQTHRAVIARLEKYGLLPMIAGEDDPAPDPPTLQEIEAYIKETSSTVVAKKFKSWYDSTGWMSGKNRITNWKAKLDSWSLSENKEHHGRQRNKEAGPTETKGISARGSFGEGTL